MKQFVCAFFLLCQWLPASTPCSAAPPVIIAQLKSRRLWLCPEGRRYAIAIGRGGIGKQHEGDGKSPVGRYALGEPRASAKFGTFIPVGYPNADDRRAGRTGGDIGIHGPPRGLFLLGIFSTWVNWTAGCLAVGTQTQIDAIADWVRRNAPVMAELRED